MLIIIPLGCGLWQWLKVKDRTSSYFLLSGSLLLMVGPVQYFSFRSLGTVGLIMELSAGVGAILVLTGFFRGSSVYTLPKWLPVLVFSILGVFGYFVIGCL
ncbi:hypothetical protein HZ993_00225 [Rhodoferax sp. AJA081-3]|uniref:hypothetical protein n=1 Tax=Rhodoferax sp. AJA081-3 TaxID=2752316 RepID=UPI001ADFD872|nr:hypothetical protein [Rhodoferax sp. AJA081-3]QTN28326.1 hypothetical protein HZ993_00225 [Rhodoferax sp. AJA081-3]